MIISIPFFKGSSWPRDWTWISCIAGRFFIIWTTREAHERSDIHIIGIPEEGRRNGLETMLDKIIFKNFLNLMNSLKPRFKMFEGPLLPLLLLSRFSHVQLCETPYTAAHQAPSSLGFSRQEHWNGLPFPSPMHESEKWKWSCLVMSDSSWPHGLQPTRLLCPWDFPGKSTGVGCHCLLWKGP